MQKAPEPAAALRATPTILRQAPRPGVILLIADLQGDGLDPDGSGTDGPAIYIQK